MQTDGILKIEFSVESEVSNSIRARQLSSMFDAPPEKKSKIDWSIKMDLSSPWNVGLVVGPSGSGKSTLLKEVWGEPPVLIWNSPGVVDDFRSDIPVEDISRACQAVGFNTMPAWMRPYSVLSNGEKFRVDLARRMLELPDPIVVDEFTSVVDRQVAKIGSHAVQKHIRKIGMRFVAVTCHYDVIEWLQPDWVLDMATRSFTRRCLQRRPPIDVVIGRVPYSAWKMFSPFHYMSSALHKGAKCFGLWTNGVLASFCAVLSKPLKGKSDCLVGVSRVVTLPDYQGLGLAMVLLDALAADYKAGGKRFRNYPAHPSFVRAHDRSPNWSLKKRPGVFSSTRSTIGWKGGRPCAVFEYVGPAADKSVIGTWTKWSPEG